jgi:3-dehydroquinate synthase
MLQQPLTIHSSSVTYQVEFPAVTSLRSWRPEADLLLVDDFFAGRLHPSLQERTLLIKADEAAKAFDRMGDLLIELKRRGLNRSSILLGLGGGVIQDITTFLASIYMRGIPWTYVPSTLLAMADSCLGGKSSINVGPAKNLVGTFHPPRQIMVVAGLARSLPPVELRGGLAEAAKICFCHGPESFDRYRILAAPFLSGEWDDEQLAQLLHHVLGVKQWFIETDEFDQAERRLLNFGHTWGHALESATGYAIPHGIAVALGMEAAHRFAGAPTGSELLMAHTQALLEGVISRDQLNRFDACSFLEAFRGDKKHGRADYHVIVPPQNGASISLGVEEQRLPRDADHESAVLNAMRAAIEEFPV